MAHCSQIQHICNTDARLWSTTLWSQVCRGNRSICPLPSFLQCTGEQSKLGAACKYHMKGEAGLEKKCRGFASQPKCCKNWVPCKRECKIPLWYNSTESYEKVTIWCMSKVDSVIPHVSAMFNIFGFHEIYGLFTFPVLPSPWKRALNVKKSQLHPFHLTFNVYVFECSFLPSSTLPHCPVSS